MFLKSKSLAGLVVIFLVIAGNIYGQSQITPVTRSWESYVENARNSKYSGLTWTTLGPVINSGRIESIDASPDKPGTIYAGFGSGNLWKTTDHGFTWKPLFDNMPGYSIGDVAVAPSNSDIIYLGTGENLRAQRGHTIPGAGVYRSNDGGESWIPLGLENSYHIGRVAVHPENPEIVFVAALGHFFSDSPDRGVYSSTDGGKKWEKVLFVNDSTGASDVIFSPSDPSVLYASTWQCANSISGPGSSVYKSIDGGKSWSEITTGFPKGKGAGRTGLAVSYSNSDLVYALTDNLNRKIEDGTCEIYRTDDGGKNWVKTHTEKLDIFSSFGHVFADCFINPVDDDEVYLLGVTMLRSSDGGESFESVRGQVNHFHPSPADFFHLDHHDMWINPLNPDHLIEGNDGGLYISYDRGEHWFHYNNIPVGEFYFVRTDNQTPYNIYGGTQDDAAVMGPARELKSGVADKWRYVWLDPWGGGDGIVTAPDPVNLEIVYYESQNGEIRRKNMTTGESVSIRPDLPEGFDGSLTREWLTPYFVSAFNHKTLFYGANYLFRSDDSGDNWRVISPDLSLSQFGERRGGGLTSVTQSLANEEILYGGTAEGAIWVSRDAGKNWREISKGLPYQYVKSIAASRYSKKRVYVVLNGIKNDDFAASVYMSDNYGATWKDISSNLPESPVNVIVEDPVLERVLYAGTFNGVFVSENMGESWMVLGSDMPHSFVADMTIQEREMDLIAATHGRGIYQISLKPVHKWLTGDKKEPAILYVSEALLPPKDMSGSKFDLTDYEDFRISFSIPEKDKLEIIFTGKAGEVVYRDKKEFVAGLNTYKWNLITGEVDDLNPYRYIFKLFPDAGEYTLRLKGRNYTLEQKVLIK